MGIDKPNYTQIPNLLIDDLIEGMNESELKVTLAVIRILSVLESDQARITIPMLRTATGLSKTSVIDGLKLATDRGTLHRSPGIAPGLIVSILTGKRPQRISIAGETIRVCSWCKGHTILLHNHHYPIPESAGGQETIPICPNCHAEYHALAADRYSLGPKLMGVDSDTSGEEEVPQ